MGLFDIFSAKSGIQGANTAQNARLAGIEDAKDTTEQYGKKSTGAINTGYNAGLNVTNTGYDRAGAAENTAYNNTQGYFGDAHDYLQSGTDQAAGYLNDAGANWQSLIDQGQAGVDRYGTLAGLNGGEAGLNAFYDTPDYLLSRAAAGQGLDSIGRSYAGTGQVGRSMTDAMDYMHKYDAGILGTARDALNPYFGMLQNGTEGYGANQGQLADLYSTLGKNQAQESNLQANASATHGGALTDIATGRAGALTNLHTGRAGDLSSIYQNMGSQLAGYDVGAGQVNAQGAQDRYAATQAANTNQWNALMGVGKMLTGFA